LTKTVSGLKGRLTTIAYREKGISRVN